MNDAPVTFPAIVVIIDDTSRSVFEEPATLELKTILRALQERESGGVSLVYAAGHPGAESLRAIARDAGIDCRELASAEQISSYQRDPVGPDKLDLLDIGDLAVLIRSNLHESADRESDIVRYAKSINRPVIEIDAQTGASRGGIPSAKIGAASWLRDVFDEAKVLPEDGLSTIRIKAAGLAQGAKPATRRGWIGLFLIQGIAVSLPLVLLPLMWLTQPGAGAILIQVLLILVSVVVMITATWYLRWRGIQKTWARSRLIAEVGRSLLATRYCPYDPKLTAFSVIPEIRPLRWCKRSDGSCEAPESWLEDYIKQRIDGEKGQLQYYSTSETKLEVERAKLNRAITLLLDLALSLAVFGVAAALFPLWRQQIIRGPLIQLALATLGTASLLGVTLIEAFSHAQDLSRQIGVCARQKQILVRARARLRILESDSAAMETVKDTENALVDEAVEWYFRLETAERFYSIRRIREAIATGKSVVFSTNGIFGRWLAACLDKIGTTTSFLLHVLIGRIIVAAGASAFALIMLWSLEGKEYPGRALLTESQAFRDASTKKPWEPRGDKLTIGTVIIVHGLNHAAENHPPEWTWNMARAIRRRMQTFNRAEPNILILDWHEAAIPSRNRKPSFADLGANVCGIWSHADEVGDQAGIKLVRWLQENKIRRDQPLHLIGHSAGGFVVARMAMVLKQFNQVPAHFRVTLLDTPFDPVLSLPRDNEILTELPLAFPGAVEIYVTSGLVRLPERLENIQIYRQPNHVSEGYQKDHEFAHEWYIGTINPRPQENKNEGGFSRSPLLPAAD